MDYRDVMVGEQQWWRVLVQRRGAQVRLICYEPFDGHGEILEIAGFSWGRVTSRRAPTFEPDRWRQTVHRIAESAAFAAFEEALLDGGTKLARESGDLVLTLSSPAEALGWPY